MMSDESNAPATVQPLPTDPGEATRRAAELDSEEAGLFAAYDRLSWHWKLGVLLVSILVIAVLLGVWHDLTFRWFEVHTGTVNESGPYYGFWSGFGSDIGEATLIAGVFAAWRHHSCHVRGCARLGRQVEGTPYLACPKHHPDHKGTRRSVSLDTIHAARDEQRS
jgi:hypothetical protein